MILLQLLSSETGKHTYSDGMGVSRDGCSAGGEDIAEFMCFRPFFYGDRQQQRVKKVVDAFML